MKNKNSPVQILTSISFYLPGYKSGGPIRSIANLVDRLEDELQFKIVTSDRDSGDQKPYPNIEVNNWNRVGKANIFYMSPKRRSLRGFKKLLCSTDYDVLYLNSFFSPHFTIKPLILRRLRLIPDRLLVIASRGEFSPGALGLKSLKKRAYLLVAKSLSLYRGVLWQASSKHEEVDIRRWFGNDVRVVVAPNLPPLVNAAYEPTVVRDKTKGYLKIIFLSRISRKKNLDSALKMLKGLKGDVQFNIYGPMEDKAYWAECEKIISILPENIEVRYCGSVEHDQVGAVMREHDIFFLPTLGENFGHVIVEAMLAGLPVLVSDCTPWRNLAKKNVGWDLPLSRPESFVKVLQHCTDMDEKTFSQLSINAYDFANDIIQDKSVLRANIKMFEDVINFQYK